MALEMTADFLVVGGGVNGTAIARDLAGRGARVVLAEKGDLAGATSSASTKLIHGGLRYLEHYEFRLVREALMEREVLWAMAPHIIWPLRFVLPYHSGLRPALLLRLGLFLYDHLGGRKQLAATKRVNLSGAPLGEGLCTDFRFGFEYSDAWVDDARLVVLNALDAAERGAQILTRTEVTSLQRDPKTWTATLVNAKGETSRVTANNLINAAGPWVGKVLGLTGSNQVRGVRLIKGSHMVVRRLFPHDRAFIFQNRDGRIVFAIPYERDFTLIGTTDEEFQGDAAQVCASPAEITYLCKAVSEYLQKPVEPQDVVWTYAGVRALYDDGSGRPEEVTRDYVLELDASAAPILSVFGGKITTSRRLAEEAVARFRGLDAVADRPAWTAKSRLPGGDFPLTGFEAELKRLKADYDFLAPDAARRLLRAYGSRARLILKTAACAADLGEDFGGGLTRAEVDYLIEAEWALTLEDILWRRSKLGLVLDAAQQARLGAYLESRV